MRRVLLPVAAVLVLAACGADPGPGRATVSPTVDATGSPAGNALRVVVDQGDGAEQVTWTLDCGSAGGGSHPEHAAACDRLQESADPFAPLPDDVVCTEQYGGPQTARVIGDWNGEPVDLELSRSDGCRIAQWDELVPVVPVPVG